MIILADESILVKLASASFHASYKSLLFALSSFVRYRNPKRSEARNFSGTVILLKLKILPNINLLRRHALKSKQKIIKLK